MVGKFGSVDGGCGACFFGALDHQVVVVDRVNRTTVVVIYVENQILFLKMDIE
jgi:hypothetical protein